MNNNIIVTTCLNKVQIGDIESNYQSIVKLIKANKSSKLIAFPLLSLTGYSCGELFNQEEFLEQVKIYLLKLVNEVTNTVTISVPLSYDEKIYICNVVIQSKKIIGIVPKICINKYESKFFSDGKLIKNKTIKLDGEITFSFDLEFTIDNTNVSFSFNNLNSDIILVPSCDKETLNSSENINKLYKEVSNHSKAIYINSSYDTSTNFLTIPRVAYYEYGRLKESKVFNTFNISYNFNLSIDKKENKEVNLYIDKFINSQTKESDINNLKNINKYPFIVEYKSKLLDVISLQAKAIITRARNTNIYNMVLGVSGGLDSTLALIALYEARKIENKIKIYGITMPYKGNTSSITKSNALDLLRLFKCDFSKEIDILKEVNQLLIDINHNKEDVVKENAQARVRTLILMSIANECNGMVIGTGDLSEVALGWCTYNGDHMAMYNVNSTIPKTLIQKVVEEYASSASDEIKKVLFSIVNTPISPELTKSNNGLVGQKTEDQIGKYEINDFILYYFLKYKVDLLTMYNLIHKGFSYLSKEEIKKAMINFYSRFISQQFKRNCSPEGAIVSEFSLSPDEFSLPSDISSSFIISLIEKI